MIEQFRLSPIPGAEWMGVSDMRDVQFLATIIAGALVILLIMLAGFFLGSPGAIKLALLAGAAMYLTQAFDAAMAGIDPDRQSLMWVIVVLLWILAVGLSISGIFCVLVR